MDMKIALVAGAVGALAGCAGAADGSAPTNRNPTESGVDQTPSTSEALAAVDANLTRLRELKVFGVGEMLVKLPAEATNCYGPCPGSEGLIAKAKEEAPIRLDKLADIAESAVKTPVADACADATIDHNLSILRELRIVDVQGLLKEEPKVSGNCYSLPCPEDIDAAKAITCERAGKLASIVNAAKDL